MCASCCLPREWRKALAGADVCDKSGFDQTGAGMYLLQGESMLERTDQDFKRKSEAYFSLTFLVLSTLLSEGNA